VTKPRGTRPMGEEHFHAHNGPVVPLDQAFPIVAGTAWSVAPGVVRVL